MDRDIALQIVTQLGAINTELETISNCVTPTNAPENSSKSALDPEDVEPMTEDPEPEPEPETRKKK